MIHVPRGKAITLRWQLSNKGVGRFVVEDGDTKKFIAWTQNNASGAKEALTLYLNQRRGKSADNWHLGYFVRNGKYVGFIAVGS